MPQQNSRKIIDLPAGKIRRALSNARPVLTALKTVELLLFASCSVRLGN